MVRSLLLVFILFASLIQAKDLLHVDFENNEIGTYGEAAAFADFRTSTASGQWFDGFVDGRAFIVDVGGVQGKALRLTYPAGCYGTTDPHACAAQVKVYLAEMEHDTLWLQFKVRFEEGFQFVKGGKLPGLCGSQCKTGGNIPSGDDGWSARHMWRTGGAAVQYLYYYGQPGNYGLDVPFSNDDKTLTFIPGQWATIVQQVSLNTFDANNKPLANGKVCSWFDGVKAACDSGYVFRTQDSMHIDKFYLSTFHGGDGVDWAPTTDVYALFDDIVVSTSSLLSETPLWSPGTTGSGDSYRTPRGERHDAMVYFQTRDVLFSGDGRMRGNTPR